jgi:hypothetical protein
MIKKASLFFVCLLLFSCYSEYEAPMPENMLTVDKMSKVMVDVNLLESALNMNLIAADSIDKNQSTPLLQTLKKHNITSQQYQQSFDYYTSNLDSLNKVYELVLIDLSKMKAEVMNKKEILKDTIHK